MIEVGEYIRTKRGYITKILKCLGKDIGYKNMQHYDVDHWTPYQGFIIYEEDIKAHSKNIIDLIEVGDYVNGIRINKKFAIKTNPVTNHKYLEYNYGFENILNDFEIKTMLTHEQYEQNCYKVGDIE